MLTDKFKAPQAFTEVTAREAAPKIEFTDKSASSFIAKLATQYVQYEKERAELPQKKYLGTWESIHLSIQPNPSPTKHFFV